MQDYLEVRYKGFTDIDSLLPAKLLKNLKVSTLLISIMPTCLGLQESGDLYVSSCPTRLNIYFQTLLIRPDL